jgi:hypothetical protein
VANTAVRTSSDTAIARAPLFAAVSAAPTVPECRIAWPAFAPRLMPESTSEGGVPKAPSPASTTMYAGDAATLKAGTSARPGSVLCSNTTRPSEVTAVSEALAPLASWRGAATTTFSPCWWAATARWRRPGAAMPSSFVIRARGLSLTASPA